MKPNDTLSHYADPNYDPVKAHEYYMKIRELKGRKKAEDTSSDQMNQEWNTSRSALDKAKQAELDAAGGGKTTTPTSKKTSAKSAEKAKKTQALKERGASLRQKLSDSAKSTQAKKEALAAAEYIRLEKERKKEIDSLPPIPNNIPSDQRKVLLAKRQEEIAKIIGEYDALYAKAYAAQATPEELAAQKAKSKEEAKKKKESLSKLKKKVTAARESYEDVQKKIKEKYDKKYSEEYERILLKYAD